MTDKSKVNYSLIYLSIAVFTALFISIKVGMNSDFWFDDVVARAFSHVPNSFIPFFIQVTELGDKKGIGLAALLMLAWLLIKKRNYVGAAVLALSIGLANEVYKILKDCFVRPRPNLDFLVDAEGYSYPSGHTLVGIVVYFIIAFLLMENISLKMGKVIIVVLAAIVLLLIGASRIILHVHYPSDVIGGYALGYIWASIWIFIYKYFRRRFN